MNAVEIEEAISALAEQLFDGAEFPFAFLRAFGNKETTLKRLRKGETNKSDLGGVLQTSNIHIAVVSPGEVTKSLAALKASPATAKAKAKFVLATDGETFEAEDLLSGETVVCAFTEFPDHFGFFLPLAGITTVKQIRESSFDIRATGRLNRLYIELLKTNPDWGTSERRHDMNHFMARLIFCFFAESTDIFNGDDLFTATVAQMSDATNTHEVIGAAFQAMNTAIADRADAKLPRWAEYASRNNAEIAFVATNSINQGAQVHQLWPRIFNLGIEISFAHKDFKWSNNATHNAAVICSIIGLRSRNRRKKMLYESGLAREVECIGPYLVPGNEIVVLQSLSPNSQLRPTG